MIYTKYGDEGFTLTLSGQRVSKNNPIIKVNGDIDSLMASIDSIRLIFDFPELRRISKRLWQLGGEISNQKIGEEIKKPICTGDIEFLEECINKMNISLEGFQTFNTELSVRINETRVRTRRLERTLTNYLEQTKLRATPYKYINRLSDFFFALAVTNNG